VSTHTIQFDQPATIAETIEALEELRIMLGPEALVRVTGFVEFNVAGVHLKAITAHHPDGTTPTAPPEDTPSTPSTR
jgi:hypothetical protein